MARAYASVMIGELPSVLMTLPIDMKKLPSKANDQLSPPGKGKGKGS